MTRARAPDGRFQAELDRLAGIDLTSLSARWRRVFGRAAPPGLSRALLHRALAYRLQADARGDLDRETIKALERTRVGEIIPLPELRTRPGTLLVREWQGAMHSVMVLDEGYAWNGQTYDSLSRVARAITGTSWNGPRFFGMRQREKRILRSKDQRTQA